MGLFRSLMFSALITGALVGVAASALHLATTVPLILKAEVIEHDGTDHHPGDGDHQQEAASEDDYPGVPGRDVLTVVAMILAYVGFALLVNVTAEIVGGLRGWRSGLGWGFAGFVAFSLVPAIGLPPELPGTPTADLMSRQLWWLAAVTCSIVAMALVYFSGWKWRWPLAFAIIVVPFAIGAPQPETQVSSVPNNLHIQFVTLTLIVSFLSWQLLAGILGWLRSRPNNSTTAGML